MPVYPKESTHPDYSSAGTSKFIPQIWSGKILTKFYASTVLSEITNTDYEGEIKKQGDTVIIRTIPNITVRTHTMGASLQYERPESAAVTLLIDKGRYWAFALDNVAEVQSDINLLNAWTDDAAMQLKISIETAFFDDATIYSDVDSNNKGANAGRVSGDINLGTTASPVTLTPANIIDTIVACGTVLDEANVPEDGRWMVIPPWMAGMIKSSDLKDASLTGDRSSILRNGRLGMIDRFTLYNSNLLKKGGASAPYYYYVLFGTKHGITFATQLLKVDHIPVAPDTFDERVRGLQVYGYKVVKGDALGLLICKKGS